MFSNRFLLLGDSLLFGVEISSNEKLQKEEEIAPVHDKGGGVVFLFDPAGGVRLVVVKAGQCDGNPDDHLRDLEDGDHDGVEPLGAHLHGHQKVVPVHGGVDTVVHDHEENTGRRGRHVGMITIEEHRDVVVPVQKDKGLFVDDNEKCVNKFRKFTENKELYP